MTALVEIVGFIQNSVAETTSYKVTQLCHIGRLGNKIEAQRKSFWLLLAYYQLLERKAPGVIVNVKINPLGES